MRAITHELIDVATRVTRTRDRLRCPRCRAVGTWKPHGGWLDGTDERRVRRWLCKWCGLYRGPEGECQASLYGAGRRRVWQLEHDGWVPKVELFPVDPWSG